MEIRSYNHELEFANLLFSKLFRNITIEKIYNGQMKIIPVRCMIGNRSRIFKDLENPEKKGTYTFPLIVVTRTGLTTDPDRIANLHNEIKYQTYPSAKWNCINYNLLTPNPVSISYTVTIISKDQATNDMIVSNFIPFFNQDLFVSCIHPKFTNVKYNSQVIFSGTINDDHPDELANDQDDFVTTTCDFTFKTYLFGGTDRKAATPYTITGGDGSTSVIYDGFVPVIKSIMLDMHGVPYLDPTIPQVVLSGPYAISSIYLDDLSHDLSLGISTYWNDEEGREVPAELSSVSYSQISGYFDPYTQYSIEKYFQDIQNRNYWPTAVDTLRWRIDEDTGNFLQNKCDILSETWENPVLSNRSDPYDIAKNPMSHVLSAWV